MDASDISERRFRKNIQIVIKIPTSSVIITPSLSDLKLRYSAGEQKNAKKRVVFKTEWFTIDTGPYCNSSEPYYRLSCNDSVSILAKTVEGKIIMVRQYRPAVETLTYEFPSCYVDDNESPLKAMKREFEEETGYRCRMITYMDALKICQVVSTMCFMFFSEKRPNSYA